MSRRNKDNLDNIKQSLSTIGKSSLSIVQSLVKIADNYLEEKSKAKTGNSQNKWDSFQQKKNPVWSAKNKIYDYRSFPLGLNENNNTKVWIPEFSHLLVTGTVGAGKTNLIQILLNHIQNNKEKWKVLYFNSLDRSYALQGISNIKFIDNKDDYLKSVERRLRNDEYSEVEKNLFIIDCWERFVHDLEDDEKKETIENLKELKNKDNAHLVIVAFNKNDDMLNELVNDSDFSEMAFRSVDYSPKTSSLSCGKALFKDAQLKNETLVNVYKSTLLDSH